MSDCVQRRGKYLKVLGIVEEQVDDAFRTHWEATQIYLPSTLPWCMRGDSSVHPSKQITWLREW